jgi:hypothetical protein
VHRAGRSADISSGTGVGADEEPPEKADKRDKYRAEDAETIALPDRVRDQERGCPHERRQHDAREHRLHVCCLFIGHRAEEFGLRR